MGEYIAGALITGLLYFAITKNFGLAILAGFLWPIMIFYVIATFVWGIGRWL